MDGRGWYGGTTWLAVCAALAAQGCADGEADSTETPGDGPPLPFDPLDRWLTSGDRYERIHLANACVAGEYVVSTGATGERRCAPCEAGTYSATTNASTCQPWSVCPPGQYVESEPSLTVDRVCTDCAAGTRTTHENSPRCVAEGECAPGTHAVTGGCEDCPAGTWNDDTSREACQAPSDCAEGSRVAEEFESTHDRRCDVCEAGTYSDVLNATACTACEPGSYCPSGSSAPELCALGSWDDDADPTTECQGWTDCDEGYREVRAGTPLNDRECSPGQWYHQLGQQGGEAPGRVAVDAAGDVYVAAGTYGDIDGNGARGGSDLFVRKLTGSTGAEVWRKQLGTAAEDFGGGIALDPNGALVVVSREELRRSSNAVVYKLSTSDGEPLWTKRFATRGLDHAVATHANGDIAVSGLSPDVSLVVKRLNASGDTLWEATLEGSGGGNGVAFDAAGNVAVGHWKSAFRPGDDYTRREGYVTLLSGDDGAPLWTALLDFSWLNYPGEIRSDADRLVLTVEANDEETGDNAQYVVLIDSLDGTLVWTRGYDQDQPMTAGFDSGGDVLVHNTSNAVERLSRLDGSSLWATAPSGPEYGLSDIAGTPNGDVAATGFGAGGIYTLLLDGSDGSEHWRDTFTTERHDALSSVTFDGSGDVIVGGSTESTFERAAPNLRSDALVRKLSGATGEALWTRQFGSDEPDATYAVRVDALGDVVVGGGVDMNYELEPFGAWDAFISKLSGADGTTLWSTRIASDTREAVEAIAIDSAGDAIVTGYTGRTSNPRDFGAFARKLSGIDGAVLWETKLVDADRMAWTAASVGVMPNGDAIASWIGMDEYSGILRLAAADGSIVWEQLDSATVVNFGGELAVDAAGNIAVLRDGVVAKLSGEDGSELWTATTTLVGGIAFDAAGDVVVGNESILSLSGADGSWLGYTHFRLDGEFLNKRLAVSGTGDVVLAGSIYPALSRFDSYTDLDGFVVKLVR